MRGGGNRHLQCTYQFRTVIRQELLLKVNSWQVPSTGYDHVSDHQEINDSKQPVPIVLVDGNNDLFEIKEVRFRFPPARADTLEKWNVVGGRDMNGVDVM